MSHLLAIAVGPVQEFIAAARRTRDLWFGSKMVSEISRAVAAEVERHGTLIFPASTTALNVANEILAELNPGVTPAHVAELAELAALAKWTDTFAGPVHDTNSGVIRRDIWDDQVGDVVEFVAAWVPLRPGKYREDWARIKRLLAGRKNCRDFHPAKGRAGVPKSSLDGLRESVLKDPRVEPWPKGNRARLRVREGEQLDVVGLVKRTWKPEGGEPRYPSVSRVAADPWLRGCEVAHPTLLDRARRECDALGRRVIRKLDLSDNGHDHYAGFPFEGTAVFRSRHHELREETQEPDETLDQSRQKFRRLEDNLSELYRAAGEPNPYLAVIVADGDQVGKTLSNLGDVRRHREFSRTLEGFAAGAKNVVHRNRGVVVYSGGDDVLAFVPVDRCLDCARELHDEFGRLLAGFAIETPTGRTKLTLSVGVAIGHFLENLEDLRTYGRDAEKDAKKPDTNGEKDSLAVHLHKRGGSPVKVRAKWTENPDARLKQYAEWLRDRKLPSRLATDLEAMARVYQDWRGDPAAAIRGDVLRVIRAKQSRGAALSPEIEAAIRTQVSDAASLRRLAEELLVARQIAAASRQANPKEGA